MKAVLWLYTRVVRWIVALIAISTLALPAAGSGDSSARAHVANGYGAGFQATTLTFPTTGSWRVTGRFGGASLSFTTLSRRARLALD